MLTKKLIIQENKTLRITNALIHETPLDAKYDNQRIIYMMQSYIKTKGWHTHGPLITSTSISKNIQGSMPMLSTKIILQLTEPVRDFEPPYSFKPLIRVPQCLFVRFTGSPQDMQYASMKLNLFAFENDITLEGSNYSVFVNQCEQAVTADVFMPIKKDVN